MARARLLGDSGNCPSVNLELLKEVEATTTQGPGCPGCSPDVVQDLLALVVVLLEPGFELGGGNHQQRAKWLSQRCLKQKIQVLTQRWNISINAGGQEARRMMCKPLELKTSMKCRTYQGSFSLQQDI